MKAGYLVRAAAKKSEAVKIADRFVAGYRPLFGIAPPRGNRRSKLRASPKTSSPHKRLSDISRGPVTFLPRDRPFPPHSRR